MYYVKKENELGESVCINLDGDERYFTGCANCHKEIELEEFWEAIKELELDVYSSHWYCEDCSGEIDKRKVIQFPEK